MEARGKAAEISPIMSISIPRSRRVGMASPPSGFRLPGHTLHSSTPPPSPLTSSPPVPARSPLRPPPTPRSRATSTFDAIRPLIPPPSAPVDSAFIASDMPLAFPLRNRSLPSLDGLLDALNPNPADELTPKALHGRTESPLPLSPMDDEASSTSSLVPSAPALSKRHHALLELLSSERNYASDLALIRDVHIPLALGQPTHFQALLPTPPSSGSSSRTVSTASDSSSASFGPPMTAEDTKIIFSNVPELAVFSDLFSDQLEEALGSVLEGGQGEDHVGALFLQIAPALERPYKQYITRHPTALEHLQALPQTPALAAYLAHTRTVASSLSHAWDLSSLLIKPVQRLLKYPLLLGAVIDETPESHGDKANLILAKQKMEEIARGVNEGRRRREIVKDVLMAKPGEALKKKSLNVGVAASVNLTKMKSLRNVKAQEGNEEVAQVERMEAELKRIDAFALDFAMAVVEWEKMMRAVVTHLRVWAVGFGKVIGLSEQQGSEAYDAFMIVVGRELPQLCDDLDTVIQEKFLRELARLRHSKESPMRLLAAMKEEEPAHYHLLNMNVSAKNRPAPGLLESSQNYLALRGQLCAELPQFLALLHKGLSMCVMQLAQIQGQFWADVRDRWSDLWDALRVEGEMNAGAHETVSVWWGRWQEVEQLVSGLNIVNPKKIWIDPIPLPPLRSPGIAVTSVLSSLDSAPSTPRRPTTSSGSSTVVPTLAMLQPMHVSAPYPLSPRGRGLSDSSSSRRLPRRFSAESLRSGGKASSGSGSGSNISSGPASARAPTKSPRRARMDDFDEYVDVGRVPLPPPLRGSASASARIAAAEDAAAEHDARGRPVRKPSVRRRVTDGVHPASSSQRRSPSARAAPSPARASIFSVDSSVPSPPASPSPRDSWALAKAKYLCQVVHPCQPPPDVSYYSFPFFSLKVGAVYEVLQEAGHPSLHAYLPLHVDDGEDCLLLVRNHRGDVGWALASFLVPLDYD